MSHPGPLHVRWLGRVPYAEALAVQRALFEHGRGQHLLLLEHPAVYTLGVRATTDNVLVDPADVGAELVRTDRGGDVTYHGPGQLVGYPVLTLAPKHGAGSGMADTVAYVHAVEQVLMEALDDLGLPGTGRLRGHPGVWVEPDGPNPRKIAAIGVRLSRGRTMHGFALNVATDLAMFGHIIPCGIVGKSVTSLAAEGVPVDLRVAADAVAARASAAWGGGVAERQDVAWRHRPDDLSAFSRGGGGGAPVREVSHHRNGRLAEAGVVGGLAISTRKPDWLRPKVHHGEDVLALKRAVRDLGLVTVCEEAGCPNLSECWADGTATFMVLGERCTRACGFCLVDTRKPHAVDASEPERVAEAVERLGLGHAVLTMVARDDLPDGGLALVAETVEAIRRRVDGIVVETLISDAKGNGDSLDLLFAVRPDILNHNLETVARLQRAVRPSAGYARSLSVLARAKAAGLTTKSGLILGMGETEDEVIGALADLAGIGVDIVTLGQYLRPTTNHLPVARWVRPEEFTALKHAGEALGLGHVEASPLTRSSYHARQAAANVGTGSTALVHS
ncbi:MAG TPA: lipoyl synthase [Acidimicrobiales bacterium]|nr:lipoyl synthase [Acidimicrobiales bacterium]